MKARKALILFTILFICFTFAGCSTYNNLTGIVGMTDTCTVIARRAQIRSSFAVVAADLLEVKRGQTLEVLEEMEFEKVLWYRVRASDEDQTEGWIEATH